MKKVKFKIGDKVRHISPTYIIVDIYNSMTVAVRQAGHSYKGKLILVEDLERVK